MERHAIIIKFLRLIQQVNKTTVIEEYYRMYRISTYWLTGYDSDDLMDIGLQAFKQMIRALKRNKVRKNPYAYYYGVLQRKIR
ncbi:hypothetical protein OCF63_20610 [Bacillus wiedmannii]|uniref:hypothetical protein n=1 Tax=Bacillus wiedmannii TaxID=1890302 RepID=UPI000BFA4ADE|nr:hypothetical protein [Bacillus wiedmannii]MCU5500346.1 hypothetical protein [Bacillus wiedmannii]PFZ04035.1 hypothetical protein COL75_11290 [Bacillus wiedmannii]